MKPLLVPAALLLSTAAHSQHGQRPKDLPAASDPYKNVLIMGEAEARAAVLHPPPKAAADQQYMQFIGKVVGSYEESLRLSAAESGLLIRSLQALSAESPSKYAVHFRVESWFRANVDQQRYETWTKLQAYPEYLFSYMLDDPGSAGQQ